MNWVVYLEYLQAVLNELNPVIIPNKDEHI